MGEHTFEWSEDPWGEGREPANGPELMEAVAAAWFKVDEVRLDALERVAALDSSEGFRYDGYTSTSAFLVHRCG
ncbi:MAG: hypothetical protein WB239_08285, partial [Acidimicrobiia bacterium]